MSLLNLYANGSQTNYITHSIVYNVNNKYDGKCRYCIKNNTIPKLFFYYGPRLCSEINLPNYKIEYYDTMCDKGHTFISWGF